MEPSRFYKADLHRGYEHVLTLIMTALLSRPPKADDKHLEFMIYFLAPVETKIILRHPSYYLDSNSL